MPWEEPVTWSADELVMHNPLNRQIRDNMEYLKHRENDFYFAAGNPAYSTSSTSWVDVDYVYLRGSADADDHSASRLIFVSGSWALSTGPADAFMTLNVNGTDFAGTYGLTRTNSTAIKSFMFVVEVPKIVGFSSQYLLRWKVTAGTINLYNVSFFMIELYS